MLTVRRKTAAIQGGQSSARAGGIDRTAARTGSLSLCGDASPASGRGRARHPRTTESGETRRVAPSGSRAPTPKLWPGSRRTSTRRAEDGRRRALLPTDGSSDRTRDPEAEPSRPRRLVSRTVPSDESISQWRSFVNDPSAGSPTETLLRLLLPLDDQVRHSFRHSGATRSRTGTNPRISLNHPIGSSDGRCVQRAGT